MTFKRIPVSLLLVLLMMLACTAEKIPAPADTSVPQSVTLVPYTSPTVTATQTQAPTDPDTQPTSTPTPRVYTVKAGDTMSGIAFTYGIDLNALLAANPDANPYALEPGMTLLLPATDPNFRQTPTLPQPTPVGVILARVDCFAQIDASLWCFVKAENPNPEAVENITAQVCLTDEAGQRRCQTAIPIIDLLPAGGSMALSTRFDPPDAVFARVEAQLLSAVRVVSAETRYINLELSVVESEPADDGLSVHVSGSIRNISGQTASAAWVAVVAVDAQERIVGVRRWEGADALAPGESTQFSLTVYSSAGTISRVDILTQAWP